MHRSSSRSAVDGLDGPSCSLTSEIDHSNDLLFKALPTNVVLDNKADPDATSVRVNSANRQGCLLRIVQLLTEVDLNVQRAFITSDGYWFVDDFRVTDRHGRKIEDPAFLKHIEQMLEERSDPQVCDPVVHTSISGRRDLPEYTSIELTGRDRVGLLREVMAVLATVDVNTVSATIWTNAGRVACILYVTDLDSGRPISEDERLMKIQELVDSVMEADDRHESRSELIPFLVWQGQTWTERRLHQMMFNDRDFISPHMSECGKLSEILTLQNKRSAEVMVKVENVPDYQYTMISVKSSDRPRVLFDTVCTLADMEYDVCHAYLKAEDGICDQEYFIKTMEGKMVESKTEQVFLEKCLEAAILRRDCNGVRLELECPDRSGLFLDVTRSFAKNGLTVTHGHLTTRDSQAMAYFYVADPSGDRPDAQSLDRAMEAIRPTLLRVAPPRRLMKERTTRTAESKSATSTINALQERGKNWLYTVGGFFV